MGGGPTYTSAPAQVQDNSAAIIAAITAQNAAAMQANAAYQTQALELTEREGKAQRDYNTWARDTQNAYEAAQDELQRKFQDEFTTKQNELLLGFQTKQQEREIQAAADRAAAVKLAQDQAAYKTEVTQANQLANQSQQGALQQIYSADAAQKAMDAASANQYAKESAGAGKSYTGPSFNIGQVDQEKMANLRAASPKMAPSAYNQAMQMKNPSMKDSDSIVLANQLGNTTTQFSAPKVDDLKFNDKTLGGY
jgi:hypothetical protein